MIKLFLFVFLQRTFCYSKTKWVLAISHDWRGDVIPFITGEELRKCHCTTGVLVQIKYLASTARHEAASEVAIMVKARKNNATLYTALKRHPWRYYEYKEIQTSRDAALKCPLLWLFWVKFPRYTQKPDSAGLFSAHDHSLCCALPEHTTVCTIGISSLIKKYNLPHFLTYLQSVAPWRDSLWAKTADYRCRKGLLQNDKLCLAVALAINLTFRFPIHSKLSE